MGTVASIGVGLRLSGQQFGRPVPWSPLGANGDVLSIATDDLAMSVVGDGEVTASPEGPAYQEGEEVTLTAEPAPGAVFLRWGGDLSGNTNPARITIDADKAVVAEFTTDMAPPTLSGVTVTPSSAGATVRWATDEPATSKVAVGTTPGYEIGSFGSTNLTRDHAVTVTGLAPGGTYHLGVSSTDAADHTTTNPDTTIAAPAGSGPLIDVWSGPDQIVGVHGQTQSWANVLGNVSDPDGVSALSYSLNGSGSHPLTIGPDGRRLQAAGDFNADIAYADLRPGPNRVVLTAVDGAGSSSSATVTIDRQAGPASLPYNTDWGAAGRIADQAQIVDGKWVLDGTTVRPQELGYDRVLTLGDISWHDYEVTVPVTVHGLGPGAGAENSGAALIGMALNWQGHSQVNNEQPARYWYPTGALGWYRWTSPRPRLELRGNGDDPVVRNGNVNLAFGQTYTIKARSETVDGGVRYSWRIWPQGTEEPSTWDQTILEPDGPPTGSVGLIAHHADAQFGNVSVTPITPPS